MAATSRFTPNSFFFTDPSALTQSAGQAFGPESEDIYRLTSKFSFSADTNAYAVCTGVVLVQPQTNNSNLVNLILRPFKQPITGFNIKYFVYRGLNIGDFFDGSNVIASGSDTSDFINKINASFSAYYAAAGTTPPPFLVSFIGFDPPNQPVGTLISDLFFKITGNSETAQTAFELPLIPAGASLGTFATGECGFDIVLDYGDYKLAAPNDQFVFDLNYARAAESKIDVTSISGDFQQQVVKEQIFQFLDVAAFYGFHASSGKVNLSNDDGTTTTKTGQEIYNSVIQNFNTKNNFYLYIQSDRSRSYNFYGNYTISDNDDNCLLKGFSVSSLTEGDYDTNGWPVLIISTTQSTTNDNIILYIQFVTDNNDNTVLYGQVGQILNDQGNNFSGPDDLQQDADESGNQPNLTKIFQLSNPSTGSNNSNYIATFNVLIYQGFQITYNVTNTDDDSVAAVSSGFLDNVFDNLNGAQNVQPSLSSNGFSRISFQRSKLINHFFNSIQSGITAVQFSIINDVLDTGLPDDSTIERITYAVESYDVFTVTTDSASPLTNDTSGNASISSSTDSNLTYLLPAPYYYTVQSFTDNQLNINGLIMQTRDGSAAAKTVIGLLKSENSVLLELITSGMTNIFMVFMDLSYGGQGFKSPESVAFEKFKIGIVAEVDGELKLVLPSTDIVVYSLDQCYLFTQQYSQYMTGSQEALSFIPVNNIVIP